ncbi:SRPBCC family protein [Ferruginibacter albus]|uniref:SRPBCC domain-containing protein n=1 Tax=Ferruginibacter albus TaxID=2875540 RepID=UPI001CC4BD09|nr:SRPBCC domain-containing protein [Ferruginibacter albus]UAY50894.1 SRPBCC domain-containing protein [Ferruginibacter albus]
MKNIIEQKDFTCNITVNKSAEKAFNSICRVSDWWVKDMDGNTQQLNEEFTVHFGTTWKTFKITEFIPYKKIVWFVVDCNLPWNTDLKEWNGTEIVWEISTENDQTKVSFTHVGLAALDCAKQCTNAWDGYINKSLFSLITEGKGLMNKF